MLFKCPYDSYAYYDDFGTRYLVFSDRDLVWAAARAAQAYIMTYFMR